MSAFNSMPALSSTASSGGGAGGGGGGDAGGSLVGGGLEAFDHELKFDVVDENLL